MPLPAPTPARAPLQEMAGSCVWGNWCGGSCVGDGGDPIDDLDQACYDHDQCINSGEHSFAETECTAGGSPVCACDAELERRATEVRRRRPAAPAPVPSPAARA